MSLRSQLLLGILLPVLADRRVNTVSLYRQALQAADTAYDRTLLASAKSIGELLEVTGSGAAAQLKANVLYSALEALRGRQPQPHVLQGQRFRRRDGVGLRRPAVVARPDSRPGHLCRAGRFLRRPLPRRAGARRGAAAAGRRHGRARHGDDPGRRDAGAAADAGTPDSGRHAVASGCAGRGDRAGGGGRRAARDEAWCASSAPR